MKTPAKLYSDLALRRYDAPAGFDAGISGKVKLRRQGQIVTFSGNISITELFNSGDKKFAYVQFDSYFPDESVYGVIRRADTGTQIAGFKITTDGYIYITYIGYTLSPNTACVICNGSYIAK